ncbi:hypothetical protein CerSpe_192530 [Prunus speciosa]
MSWNTMIDGYMKNGKVDDAVKLFEQMPQRDAVSWTILIGGFVKKDLGTLGLGLWINQFIMKQDFRDNIRISNSLIDMYSRCGCIGFGE